MIKKSRILSIILFCIPLLIAIGFSSWIIIYEVILSPSYVSNPVSPLFKLENSTVYNGYEQVPQTINEDDLDGYNVSYEYKYQGEDEVYEGKPSDAGEYDVKIIVYTTLGEFYGSCQVRFTIEPLKIKAKEVNLTVAETGICTWGEFYDYISEPEKKLIDFTDSSGNDLADNLNPSYILTTMTNNDVNCSYNDENDSTIVHGSTYILNMTLLGSSSYNYALYDVGDHYLNNTNKYGINGSCIVKYKSVYVGDDKTNYYTIEDAITTGGEILLYGSSSAFITAFSNFEYYKSKNEITLNSSSSIWVSYNGNKTLTATSSSGNTIYSVLFVPSGVTLIANGTINVCGVISSNTHTTRNRGVLFNNGVIELNGQLNSYGFVNGAGRINANGTSKVYDIIKLYNYTAGGPLLLMSNANVFPISCYSIHNISCDLKLEHTATYIVPYKIDIGLDVSGDLVLIGDNGLFDLSNGYIIKKVEDTTSQTYINKSLLSSYNVSNQDITQRDVIEVYGSFSDNIVSMTATYLGIKKGIETGKNYAMPMGFMNINLKDDGKGNVGKGELKNNSYKFLPGSRLVVDEGCSLTVSSGLNIIFYDENYDDLFTFSPNASSHTPESMSYRTHHSAWFNSSRTDKGAQFIVNGTLESSGNIGGEIKTTSDTGFISLSSSSATLVKVSSMEYEGGEGEKISIVMGKKAEIVNDTVYATGNINKEENKQFSSTAYVSMLDGTNGYWVVASNARQFTLNFYDYNENKDEDELVYSKKVYVITPESDGKYYYTIKGTEYLPSKLHYEFDEWLLANDTSAKDEVFEHSTNNSINLYASWNEVQYNFQYMFGYQNGDNVDFVDNSNVTLTNLNLSFTYSEISSNAISITTKANYNNKVFNGWFLGTSADAEKIGTTLSKQNFDKYLLENPSLTDISIFGLFTDDAVYTINLDHNNENYNETTLGNKKTSDNISLPNMSGFDNVPTKSQYFEGWYIDPNYTTEPLDLNNNVGYIVDLIEQYNLKASESNKINIDNGVITLYAKCPTKQSIEFYKGTELNESLGVNDGVALAVTYWYKPGSTVSFPEPNVNEQGHTFKGWATTNVTDGTFKYASCSVITVAELENNNITKLYASYTVNSYKVTIESNSKINSVKSGSTSITSGATISYGITLTINIDNVTLTGSTYNCNVYNSKNVAVFTLTSNKALFASGTTNGTYVFLACDDITIKVG